MWYFWVSKPNAYPFILIYLMPFTFLSKIFFTVVVTLLFFSSGTSAQGIDSVTSSDKLFSGTFANDATFRIDYYYTQGITANLILPAFRRSLVTRITLKPKTYQQQHHGIKIWYEGFTPLKLLDSDIRYGDRPYAAYIYTTHYTVATNSTRNQRLTSGLDIGFIGPGAGAEKFQTEFHRFLGDPLPQGWDYQIQTDLILGYRANFEKQLWGIGRVMEIIGNAGASAGTLYTHATGGFLFRTGKMNPYFRNLGIASKENRANLQKFQFYGHSRADGRFVGYNGTLQGGFLNKSNPYTLPAAFMKRGVLQTSTGLTAAYGGISFESSVVWLSREIKGGRKHQWMYFDLRFAF